MFFMLIGQYFIHIVALKRTVRVEKKEIENIQMKTLRFHFTSKWCGLVFRLGYEVFIVSFINKRDKEINCKIAYVGPAFSGKTTSLRHIYEETAPGHRGKITTISGTDDKTLFFDFLPLTLGKVKDYSVFIRCPGR
jgi:hypothetical protein